MADNHLEILLNRSKQGRQASTPPVEPVEESGGDEDQCQAFGYLRGIRDRALFIEFRFRNGNIHALPYSWLGPTLYNPSAGILLKFVVDNVSWVLIQGSNLNALVGGSVNLFDRGIVRNRICWVREMSRQQAERARPGEVVIDHIRIASHSSDESHKEISWLEPFWICNE